MKYIGIFILLSFISCKREEKESSMFFFIPKDISSLKENGYKGYSNNHYSKKVADTLEYITIGNLDSGQFSKHFLIQIRTGDTTSMIDFIANNADSVLMRLRNVLFIRRRGNLYLIEHGHSGNKKGYVLSYRNLHVYDDRILAVRNLISFLDYSDTADQLKIINALRMIDVNWEKLPRRTPADLSVPVEEAN